MLLLLLLLFNSFVVVYSCEGKVDGMYSDVEARCQVWHQCLGDRRSGNLLLVHPTVTGTCSSPTQ